MGYTSCKDDLMAYSLYIEILFGGHDPSSVYTVVANATASRLKN
jgi:hypothetical protein